MDINIRTILAGIGGVTGIGAVISFLQTELFSSPVTTAIALMAVGLLILVITYRADDKAIRNIGVILCSFSIIASVLYGVISLTSGTLTITLTLTILTIGFLAAAYISQTERKILTQKKLTVISVIFLCLFAFTAIVDAVMGEPEYNLELEDTITEVESTDYRSNYIVGTLTVSNPSFLPLDTERQSYRACLTGLNLSNKIENADEIESVLGGMRLQTEQIPGPLFSSTKVNILFSTGFVSHLEEAGVSVTDIPVVEDTRCPDSTEQPQLTVIVDGDTGISGIEEPSR